LFIDLEAEIKIHDIEGLTIVVTGRKGGVFQELGLLMYISGLRATDRQNNYCEFLKVHHNLVNRASS
jgi:hypothetical protein